MIVLDLLQVLYFAIRHLFLERMHLYLFYCKFLSRCLFRDCPYSGKGTFAKCIFEVVVHCNALNFCLHLLTLPFLHRLHNLSLSTINNFNQKNIKSQFIINIKSKKMYQPRTLQEYIEMRNLQRKRENYLVNEAKNFPNPISLDKQKKIDHLILEILDFVKHITGQGPIFHRFRVMMQNLYQIFQKQLSDFHKVELANKFHKNNAYLQEMKKANLKLKEYLQSCENENKEVNKKLEHLVKGNKELNSNMIFINKNNSKKEEIQDNFQDDQEQPQKIVKVGKIDFDSNKLKAQNLFLNQKQDDHRHQVLLKASTGQIAKESANSQFMKRI